MQKALKVFLHSIPVLLMIGLIPLVQNDYILTVLYVLIITVSLRLIGCTKKDLIVLLFGFIVMIVTEYIFISTGVETFVRNSLFGLMPLWLPFLWSYGFVAIKKSVETL